MRYTLTDYRKRVFRAMNFISMNVERDLSLEEIARTASFSSFHFHRIFKAVVGETVADFTRRLRLELAANRLLSKRREDITTIAMNCGFSSSQNFSKAFRQHFGTTASEYRKNGSAPPFQRECSPDSLPVKPRSMGVTAAGTTIEEMPEYTVAFVRSVGPYVGSTCGPAFAELMRWAGPRRLAGPGKIFGIYWDNPEVTPPPNCRFDACVIVPEGTVPPDQVFTQTIGGGLYASCRFEAEPDGIRKAWDEAFVWLCDGGYECRDTPCCERYWNNASEHPDGRWILDVCIPLMSGR